MCERSPLRSVLIIPAGKAQGRASQGAAMGRREANAEASWCDCNICLDVAKHPALTLCGHLYCSACIETWLRMGRNTCPVCKAPCDRAITIYGRGRQGPGPNGRSVGAVGVVAGRTKAQSGWPGAGAMLGDSILVKSQPHVLLLFGICVFVYIILMS